MVYSIKCGKRGVPVTIDGYHNIYTAYDNFMNSSYPAKIVNNHEIIFAISINIWLPVTHLTKTEKNIDALGNSETPLHVRSSLGNYFSTTSFFLQRSCP